MSRQKRIAQVFVIACTFISIFLASLVLVLIFKAPSLLVQVVISILMGIVPIPLLIWGVTLFVRYIRLFQAKLKISPKRLWIETIALNLINFGFFFWLMSRTFSLYIVVVVCVWNVIAIILSVIALSKSIVSNGITVSND